MIFATKVCIAHLLCEHEENSSIHQIRVRVDKAVLYILVFCICHINFDIVSVLDDTDFMYDKTLFKRQWIHEAVSKCLIFFSHHRFDYWHKKQSGGRGEYARVIGTVEVV